MSRELRWIIILLVPISVLAIILLVRMSQNRSTPMIGAINVEAGREQARRVDCSARLRKLGIALNGYASEHGLYPSNLADLGLAETEMRCPDGEGYNYLGSSLKFPADDRSVIAYDSVEWHRDGANFLLGNGMAWFVDADDAKTAIAQLKNGLNPPPALSVISRDH